MKINKYLWILLSLFICGGCESLEDTYDDYAGEGTIRYLGKCQELELEPGWERLIATWQNHIDPAIEKVKLSWTLDGTTQDVLLEKGTTTYSIPNLTNATYEVSVCGMDKDGNTSLPIYAYLRPYTADHENVLSYTRIVNKHFFMKNRLVLFFGEWQSLIKSAKLNYSSGGEYKVLELDSVFVTNNPYYLLPDPIDINTDITIERSGYLLGCPDLIEFVSFTLPNEKIFTPEFKVLIQKYYGVNNITEELANSLEELEFDYSMTSFEDILHLPNLKTLYLGKNRYLGPTYLSSFVSASQVTDKDKSRFVLQAAHEIYGLTVERYNQHYFPNETFSFMEEKGNPALPSITHINAADWNYYCSVELYDEGLDVLFNETSTAGWQPYRHNDASYTYEIVVDLQEAKQLSGATISQKLASAGSSNERVLAKKVKIKTSINQISWQDATYVEEITLGATSEETTIIQFPSTINARYIKFILADQVYSGSYNSISLGKIRIF